MRWYFPTIAAHAKVLESAGLEPRLLLMFDRPTRLAGADGLAVWLQIFLAPLATHLGPRWRPFVRAVDDRCRACLFVGSDWVLDYVRLRLRALKPTTAPR